MLVLTRDSAVFTVPDGVASRCGTLRTAMDECGDGGVEHVPVPNVLARDMASIVEFYTHLGGLSLSNATPGTAASYKTAFFARMPPPDLFALMNAANYLDARELLEDASAYVADLIRGKSPEAIRDILHLRADVTAAESAHIGTDFKWAFP